MLGQKQRKKRAPLVDLLLSIGTAILVLVVFAGACFLLCTILFTLNQGNTA